MLFRAFDVPMPPGPFNSHEETWSDLPVAVEIKSGLQVERAWQRWRQINRFLEPHRALATERSGHDPFFAIEIALAPAVCVIELDHFAEALDNWPFEAFYVEHEVITDGLTRGICGPMVTLWRRCELQIVRNRHANDRRPIVVVAMPLGTTNGLVMIETASLSYLAQSRRVHKETE
jgi:hypothetical protein